MIHSLCTAMLKHFSTVEWEKRRKKKGTRYRVLFPVNVYCVILHNVPGIWLGWADAVEGVCLELDDAERHDHELIAKPRAKEPTPFHV